MLDYGIIDGLIFSSRWENFVESIAHVLSVVLTNGETELVVARYVGKDNGVGRLIKHLSR